MKLTEIQDLIKFVARSGVTEVEIEQTNFKIIIKAENAKKRDTKGNEGYAQAQMNMPQMGMPQMAMQAPAPMPQPAPQQAPQAAAEAKAPAAAEAKYITVKSPMIGTFYRSGGPDKPPFVSVGDEIKPGKVICIVEAMKLFNEIEAEMSGKIVKVLIDDASPVEYDQPLFLVDPS